MSRFLDHLLQGTAYQLHKERGAFVVVHVTDEEKMCRVNVDRERRQLRAPHFLAQLYRLHQTHRLRLRSYLYTPPKETVSAGTSSVVTGGNCSARSFRLDFTYWKSISTRYSQAYWVEACKLGHKLKRWDGCFAPPERKLFVQRMKRICRKGRGMAKQAG